MDPRGFRVGVTKKRPVERYANTTQQGAQFFCEDISIRELVDAFYYRSAISKIFIRKTDTEGELVLSTAKPAAILGKDGVTLKKFEALLLKKTGKSFKVTVKDVKTPELSAKIMSEFACQQLENRMSYRRVAKSVLQKVMEKGAIGVKVQIAGRLGGADMSRNEKFSEGRIPLQTLRADIDYHYTIAKTKYGVLGVKVWICRSENMLVKTESNVSKL